VVESGFRVRRDRIQTGLRIRTDHAGGFLDRVGTRFGFKRYVAGLLDRRHADLARFGPAQLRDVRFLLGAGESANWPGATKAVAECFRRRSEAEAVALFDSGSQLEAAVAPFSF